MLAMATTPLNTVIQSLSGIYRQCRNKVASFAAEPGAQDDGPFVAEVWLEWSICRGSALYRQRFKDEQSAHRAARAAAKKLDRVLPTHYVDTDWSGRRVLLEHEYGIHWGVRPATERDSTRRIWSPTLPGRSDFAGEHAMAHPAFGANAQHEANKLGYRL